MKKRMILCGILAVLLFLGGLVMQSSLMYGGDEIVDGGVRYYPHGVLKTCFAADLKWPAGEAEAVVDIPDECGGYRVTELGGYIGRGLPCPFMVTLAEPTVVYSESSLPAGAKIEDRYLTLNIGRNLAEAANIAMNGYYCIGPGRFLRILVMVNCSGENPHFYAENGRLYRTADDSLVEGFFYRHET